MSRGTWEATVAAADARGAERKAKRAAVSRARRLARERRYDRERRRVGLYRDTPEGRVEDLRARRDRYAARTAARRRRAGLLRMNAEVRALPTELAEAYRVASPEVRLLIREQARDARRPFDAHGPDFAKVLAVRGCR